MKTLSVPSFALLVLLTAAAPAFTATLYVDDLNDGQVGTGTSADPYRNLQTAINRAVSGDTLFIRSGRYIAVPVAFTEQTCGNCDAASFRQSIPATRGFRIAGKSLVLQGESRTGTILETRAGYGVLFESAGSSRVENLTITGGIRDADGRATNGAVVARSTTITVRNADLSNNSNVYTGTPDPVVGISGIVGREGSVITADNLTIHNNSWDGIAMYRGDPAVAGSAPRATITNVTIDTGRGVGIGTTWDAQSDITNARISGYWKGVGSFGSSRVTLRNSIVRDQLAWGVQAGGTSTLTATNNVVTRQGTVGMAQWDTTATVIFTNNIVYDNGRDPNGTIGPRTGMMFNDMSRVTYTYNDVYANQLQNVCMGFGCTPISFAGTNGNISANPLFVNAAGNNFALQCASPAINTGSPSITDRDGTRSDMGAYGGPSSPQIPPSCALADLQPTAITYTPTTIVAGNQVAFDSGVRNAGLTGTGSFNIKWFVDGVQLGYGGHVGVPANTTIMNDNSSFTWTATQGTHTITFSVDVDNFVTESNESNNSTSVTISVAPALPDLVPTAITYTPASPEAGDVIAFDSGVRNQTSVASGSFNVKWFIDGVQVGYGGHTGVPGNTTVLNGNSFLNWTATQGTHTVTWSVDVDNFVAETNEGNNSTSITVVVSAPRPDLTPTAILYNSGDLVRGRQVLFDSGVQNLKPVSSGSFNIKWFVDGVQVGYGGHTGVPGNTTVLNGNSAFTWTAVAGTHTLTFSVDVDNYVAESNEANNSRSVTVTVP